MSNFDEEDNKKIVEWRRQYEEAKKCNDLARMLEVDGWIQAKVAQLYNENIL